MNDYDLTEIEIPVELTLKNHTKRSICGSCLYLEYLETEKEVPGAMIKPTAAFDVFENIPEILVHIADYIDSFYTTDGKRTYHNSGFLIYDLPKVRRMLEEVKNGGKLQSTKYWIQRDMNSENNYLTIRGVI